MRILCGSGIPISRQSVAVPGWELAVDTLLLAQCGAGMDGRMDRGSKGGGWGEVDTIALVSATRLLNA